MPAKDRRLLYSDRLQDRLVETYEGSDVTNVFADAIGRVYLGPQVSKIELCRTTFLRNDPGPVEERELYQRLTLPTVVLYEALGNVLASTSQQKAGFDQAAAVVMQAIRDAVKKAKDVDF